MHLLWLAAYVANLCMAEWVTIFVLSVQLEQEIDLILEKRGVCASATDSWISKWIPAIKEYATTLSGKMAMLVSETMKDFEGCCVTSEYMHYSDNFL